MTPPPLGRRPVLLASLLVAGCVVTYVRLVVPSGVVDEAPWLADGYVACGVAGIGLVTTAPAGRTAWAWVAWWIGTCSVMTLLLLPIGYGSDVVLAGFVLGSLAWGAITGPAGAVYGIVRAVASGRRR